MTEPRPDSRAPAPGYRYRGAQVLVALHEEALLRFYATWGEAKAAGAAIPKVADPDYVSFDALLAHVFRWARAYLGWCCAQLELADPEVRPVPETRNIEAEAASFLGELLEKWRVPLCDVEERRFFEPEYTSPWGVRYSVEAMLEHAVLHPARHRFQIEEWMGRRPGPAS